MADRPDLWRALPREVADWWRDRDRDRETPAAGEAGIARLDGPGLVVFERESSGMSSPAADPPAFLEGPATSRR